MVTRIVGATLRDLSYIAARLRPDDLAEVSCQFDEFSPALLAALSLRDEAYVVELDGNPEAAFGAGRAGHSGLFVAWSWGSRRMWRCIPRITEFVREAMIPAIYAANGMRVEARALTSNLAAHRWLRRMGAREQGLLQNYGKNGEDFTLFEWTRSRYEAEPAIQKRLTEECQLSPPA